MVYAKFHNGINFGGWLSQYELIAKQPLTPEHLREHFDSFITEKDVQQAAERGFDHIRLPISGYLLYDLEQEQLNPDTVFHIHEFLSWCAKYKLSAILDLHDVWGNEYGAMNYVMPLLKDPILQERFCRIWKLMAEEFRDVTEPLVMYELLNEVSDGTGAYPDYDVTGEHVDLSDKDSFAWNSLWKRALFTIRTIDPKRLVLIGGNGQNSVVYLKELSLISDPYVCANFHYYDPQVFTHQRAGFSEEMSEFDHVVHYPDDISDFVTYLAEHPKWQTKYALVGKETRNDHDLMKKLLAHAFHFQRETGKEVYCGEFGVIATAPGKDARAWLTDFTNLLDAHEIGHALWNYKYLDFGLLGLDGKPASSLLP